MAANYAATDTLKKKISTKNDTYFYNNQEDIRHGIDTAIHQLHRYNYIYNDGIENLHIGNTGSAAYSVIYTPSKYTGFDLGFKQHQLYAYFKDSIKYYQVLRPYTELGLYFGMNKETVVNVKFANSHKKTIFYGFDFSRISSPGSYSHQYNQTNGFVLYGKYNSKNNFFELGTDIVFNQYAANENGGTKSNYLQQDTTFFKTVLSPINTSNATTTNSTLDWYINTALKLGKKINTRENDSVYQKKVVPLFKLGYEFSYGNSHNLYRDKSMDSVYYALFYNKDSIRFEQKYNKISNAFVFQFTPHKITSDSTFTEAPLMVNAQLGLDYYFSNMSNFYLRSPNAYVKGNIRSNENRSKFFNYNVSAQYFFAGYNQHDLIISGNLKFNFKKIGKANVAVDYQLREADYIYNNLILNNVVYWQQKLPKSNSISFGGDYTFSHKIFSVKAAATNYILKNIFYFDNDWTPQVATKPTNVFIFQFANRLGIKGFHFDNDIWFQKVSGSDVIRLPTIATKTSIYYERHLFKNFLWFAVGADLRYYSKTQLYGYAPLLGQFYLQNNTSSNFYPVLDVFLNLKIKTVRISLQGNNLSQLMTKNQVSYYGAAYYPMRNASFMFGVKWRFFE